MKIAFIAFLTTTSALAQQIAIVQPTVQELAGALGVRPYCWDVTLPEARFARLVAVLDGSQQFSPLSQSAASLQVRVFVFTDPAAGHIQRISYRLQGASSESIQGFEQSLAGCAITSIGATTEPNLKFTVLAQGASRKEVSLSVTLETSREPFPAFTR